MEGLGVFAWLGGMSIRLVLREDYLIRLDKFSDEYGWLSYGKHVKIAPTNLGVWNDDC
jgi:hypothetical protein